MYVMSVNANILPWLKQYESTVAYAGLLANVAPSTESAEYGPEDWVEISAKPVETPYTDALKSVLKITVWPIRIFLKKLMRQIPQAKNQGHAPGLSSGLSGNTPGFALNCTV